MRVRPSLVLALCLAARALGAQAVTDPPAAATPATATPAAITPAAVTPAPIVMWRDLAVLGGGALAAWAVHGADLRARERVRSAAWQDNAFLDGTERMGYYWGQPGVVIAGAALWGGGRWRGNETVAATGLRALEAVVISGTITKGLKAAFGRARPRVSPTDAWDVEFGRGWDNDHEAFPSGHTTAAFAFAAAVTSEVAHRAPRRAAVVGTATYAVAVGTAYARMHADAHWLSDVTMGAAVGMATGWAVTRWHRTRPGNRVDRLLLGVPLAPYAVPTGDGVRLGATVSWR